MKLTARNYFSRNANLEYFSVSQFKDFCKCPACAMAKLNGEYDDSDSRALLLGSYVDEMLTGTNRSQKKFLEDNSDELLQKNGKFYADVVKANEAVARVIAQPLMMKYLNGKHQTIMTGEIEGVPVKIKMDSYKPGEFVADLKYLKSLRSPNMFENVVDYWGYPLQGAVYTEIVRQNTGETLPFFLVIATKESPAHLAVCEVKPYNLEAELDKVKANIRRFQAIKEGKVEAERCEAYDCDYCTITQMLDEPIPHEQLGLSKKEIVL